MEKKWITRDKDHACMAVIDKGIGVTFEWRLTQQVDIMLPKIVFHYPGQVHPDMESCPCDVIGVCYGRANYALGEAFMEKLLTELDFLPTWDRLTALLKDTIRNASLGLYDNL